MIRYRLGMKLLPSGGILRNESIGDGKQFLKSEIGVRRFCEELSPFVSIIIYDNGDDVTKDFTPHFQIVQSRYEALREKGIVV